MWSDGFSGADGAGVLSSGVRQFEMPVFDVEIPVFSGHQSVQPEEPAQEGPEEDRMVEISGRIEALEREAFEKGYKTGEEAGYAMGEQKAQVLLERLQTIIEELTALKDRTIREMEPQFVELAMSAARQIVVEELTLNQEALTRITREALSKMQPQQRVTIRTSPFVCDIVSKYKPEMLQGGTGEIFFEADPHAPRFGSVIAGPVQEIETGIDEQLKNMIKQMSERLGQAGKR